MAFETPLTLTVVNPEALLEEISGDRDLLAVLVDTALNDLPENLRQTQEALAAGALDTVKSRVHAMKTTLAHWQAAQSADLARAIEAACVQNQPAQVAALVPQLVQAVHVVINDLNLLKASL